jgi:hypothetical protein
MTLPANQLDRLQLVHSTARAATNTAILNHNYNSSFQISAQTQIN